MGHNLKLYVDDIQRDEKHLYLHDLSEYDSDLEVKNKNLQMLAPNNNVYFEIPVVAKNFVLDISSTTLGLSNGAEYIELPDGQYVFKYSVSPNASVNTTYQYYRVTKLKNEYLKLLEKAFSVNGLSIDPFGNLYNEKIPKTLSFVMGLFDTIEFLGLQATNVFKANYIYEYLQTLYRKLQIEISPYDSISIK